MRALRTFRLGPDGQLFPLYDDRAWLPGANVATCRRGHQHAAPAPDCRCGFYAYGDAAWIGAQPPSRSVLAVVALWGQIEVASRGLRAGTGRIEALWLHPRVDDALVARTASAYPEARLYRDRDELLDRHPLTDLDGYQHPRLTARDRRRLRAATVTLGAAVLAAGCVPASVLATTAGGVLIALAALLVSLGAALLGLARRSAATLTAGIVGLGWLLSSTASTSAAVWTSRLPLLIALTAGAVVWAGLAAPGRPVPRRRHVLAGQLLSPTARALSRVRRRLT